MDIIEVRCGQEEAPELEQLWQAKKHGMHLTSNPTSTNFQIRNIEVRTCHEYVFI